MNWDSKPESESQDHAIRCAKCKYRNNSLLRHRTNLLNYHLFRIMKAYNVGHLDSVYELGKSRDFVGSDELAVKIQTRPGTIESRVDGEYLRAKNCHRVSLHEFELGSS